MSLLCYTVLSCIVWFHIILHSTVSNLDVLYYIILYSMIFSSIALWCWIIFWISYCFDGIKSWYDTVYFVISYCITSWSVTICCMLLWYCVILLYFYAMFMLSHVLQPYGGIDRITLTYINCRRLYKIRWDLIDSDSIPYMTWSSRLY